MEEIFTRQDYMGETYIVKLTEWYYKEGEDLVVMIKNPDSRKNLIVTDKIKEFRPAEIEDAKIAIGNHANYLLYDEDYLPNCLDAIKIEDWRIYGHTEHREEERWTEGLYLILRLISFWKWDGENIPRVNLEGTRKIDNGASFPIHSDEIKAIVRLNRTYIALSKRHKYLLKGEPTDLSHRLKNFVGLY